MTTLDGGVLRVDCDDAADTVQVDQLSPLIQVLANGDERTFPEEEVNVVWISTSGGDDQITLSVERRAYLFAGQGNDLIRVWRTGAGTVSYVTCGAIDDADRIEMGKEGGTLDDLRGYVNLIDQRNGTLFVYDDGSTTGQQYGINDEGHVYRGGRDVFNYTDSTPTSVAVFTSQGDDTVLVGTIPANRELHYHLGPGDDTVRVQPDDFFNRDIAGVLDVVGGKGTDAVQIDERHNMFGSRYVVASNSIQRRGIIRYTEVEGVTLQTGNHRDRLVVEPAAKVVPLTVDAGGGTDELDYSRWSEPVHVSLREETADGFVAVVGVENVVGGQGDDVLRGDAAANVLDGGPGNDILLGEEGADILRGGDGRDFLLGGLGADLLNGGCDEDILFGNGTIYDQDEDALLSLLQIWGGSEPYEDRVTVLRDYFTVATVLADEDADEFLGGDGMDWFWCDLKEVLDHEEGEHIN